MNTNNSSNKLKKLLKGLVEGFVSVIAIIIFSPFVLISAIAVWGKKVISLGI